MTLSKEWNRGSEASFPGEPIDLFGEPNSVNETSDVETTLQSVGVSTYNDQIGVEER